MERFVGNLDPLSASHSKNVPTFQPHHSDVDFRHSREGGNPGAAPNGTHWFINQHRLDSRLRGNDGDGCRFFPLFRRSILINELRLDMP